MRVDEKKTRVLLITIQQKNIGVKDWLADCNGKESECFDYWIWVENILWLVEEEEKVYRKLEC